MGSSGIAAAVKERATLQSQIDLLQAKIKQLEEEDIRMLELMIEALEETHWRGYHEAARYGHRRDCTRGRMLSVWTKGNSKRAPAAQPPTFSEYHLRKGGMWERVNRVLVLPFFNESEIPQPQVADRGPRRVPVANSSKWAGSRSFRHCPTIKAVLARRSTAADASTKPRCAALARATNADVIVHGIITHYSPYPRPRIGIVLQAVSPEQAKVMASVDGVWDTTDNTAAERGNAYYRQRIRPRLPVVRNNYIIGDDRFAEETVARFAGALPALGFPRSELAASSAIPVPGVVSSGMNSQGVTGVSVC